MQSGQLHGFSRGAEKPFPLYCRHRSKEKSPAFVGKAEPKEAFSAKQAAGRRTKNKNSWGDAAESRLETSCGSLWIKWLSAAKKRNAARSGMPFSFRKHLFCSKKHYIEKRPDCQANFNFSRNMRKNKRVFCQISMKRRRSAGVRARSSAPARSSSCSPRNPQTQPMVCTPAFLPV